MTDNKNTISRRSFIKAAGVGSLGLALTTPNNASAISSSVNKENRDYIATKKSKKIIYNGYVITMDEKYGDLENGAILVENDTIIDIGDISKFAHINAELIDAEDLKMATLVGSLEALDAGVTTILDCCDCVNTPQHAEAAIGSLRESGIRSIYAYGTQSYDYKGENRFKTHSQRIETAKEIYQKFYKNNNTINKMGVLLSDFGTIPFEHTRQEIEQAKKMGIFIASHTGAAEKSILLKGLHELKQNNLLHPGHLHIHCTSLDRSEWDILSQTGGKVSIAPETEMQMGMGRPPFRASIDHGFKPGLSTDIVCVGSGDLFSQMRLGLQFQRCMDNEATANRTGKTTTHIDLSVRDALAWATQGSAEALGMEKQIGTLTPNKKADIIIVSQSKAFVPSSYPAGSIVLQTTASDVDTVIINGEVKKRFGKLLHHDVEKIRAEATATLKHIQEKAKSIPNVSPEEIAQFFDVAQEQARENFAQAYKK